VFLIFDSVQFEKCLNDGKKNEIEQATKNFMNEYKNLYGFEPIGFEFHLDEGTTIDFDKYERLDTEEQKNMLLLIIQMKILQLNILKKCSRSRCIFKL